MCASLLNCSCGILIDILFVSTDFLCPSCLFTSFFDISSYTFVISSDISSKLFCVMFVLFNLSINSSNLEFPTNSFFVLLIKLIISCFIVSIFFFLENFSFILVIIFLF